MKKQFGLAAIALTTAMTFSFTACGGDSSSSSDEPTKVSKVEDLSEDCEDGEEALVGDKETLYTCDEGKWTTEETAKSSASKSKSSSSKIVESSADEECDADDCDEEDETPSSSSKKESSASKGDNSSERGDDDSSSGSSDSSDSGDSDNSSASSDPDPETPKCTDTEEQLCVGDELVDKAHVDVCGEVRFDNTKYFCSTDVDEGTSIAYPYCTGKKTYIPKIGGQCGDDGNYYYSYMDNGVKYAFEDTRDHQSYTYNTYGTQTWMTQNLRYTNEDVSKKSACAKGIGATEASCLEFGRLYEWSTATAGEITGVTTVAQANDIQGICPAGWRLPSSPDYKDLMTYMNAKYETNQAATEAMQSTGYTAWPNATNESEFNMQLVYAYNTSQNRTFIYMGTTTAFSSTKSPTGYSYSEFYFGEKYTSTSNNYPSTYSLFRCIKR